MYHSTHTSFAREMSVMVHGSLDYEEYDVNIDLEERPDIPLLIVGGL